MALTQGKEGGVARLMDTIEEAGTSSLEAMRKFADTINDAVPHLDGDEALRRKFIDSAFKMTEQLVSTASKLAQRILEVTEAERDGSPAHRATS